jgi:peptidoglycan hydrolase-like protein with peptidoglycan-binding domain
MDENNSNEKKTVTMQEQTTIPQQEPQIKKGNAGKIVLISIGVIGLGAAGLFAMSKLRQKPTEVLDNSEMEDFTSPKPLPKTSIASHTNTSGTTNTGFPIKRGSKGEKVRAIQQVLASKGLLAASDVIGQYGPKTEAALIKAGFPTAIDEKAFNAITGKTTVPTTAPPSLPPPIDHSKFAQALYASAISKNFSAAMSVLKLMKTTGDYSAVSEKFKTYFIGGVRKTLVNGMLDAFTSIDQKAQIKQAFLNMGLKYDGSKFSLSGLPDRGIITKQKTTVYDQNLRGISVEKNTILGTEAGRRGSYTQFRNKGRYFLVPTQNINYL